MFLLISLLILITSLSLSLSLSPFLSLFFSFSPSVPSSLYKPAWTTLQRKGKTKKDLSSLPHPPPSPTPPSSPSSPQPSLPLSLFNFLFREDSCENNRLRDCRHHHSCKQGERKKEGKKRNGKKKERRMKKRGKNGRKESIPLCRGNTGLLPQPKSWIYILIEFIQFICQKKKRKTKKLFLITFFIKGKIQKKMMIKGFESFKKVLISLYKLHIQKYVFF